VWAGSLVGSDERACEPTLWSAITTVSRSRSGSMSTSFPTAVCDVLEWSWMGCAVGEDALDVEPEPVRVVDGSMPVHAPKSRERWDEPLALAHARLSVPCRRLSA
jgi:hypothetical protein